VDGDAPNTPRGFGMERPCLAAKNKQSSSCRMQRSRSGARPMIHAPRFAGGDFVKWHCRPRFGTPHGERSQEFAHVLPRRFRPNPFPIGPPPCESRGAVFSPAVGPPKWLHGMILPHAEAGDWLAPLRGRRCGDGYVTSGPWHCAAGGPTAKPRQSAALRAVRIQCDGADHLRLPRMRCRPA